MVWRRVHASGAKPVQNRDLGGAVRLLPVDQRECLVGCRRDPEPLRLRLHLGRLDDLYEQRHGRGLVSNIA